MPIRRTLKNVVKNYSDAQVKVREATSNDPWGPSSTLMSEIADLTYNVVAFTEIMQMVWKRLNDHGRNWRHVYKALVLLDYIIKTGSEKVAQQCKENIYAIQTLKDFQYVEDNKDMGMNVREKAKQLVTLLKDDERLKNERAKALKAKERFAQSTVTSMYGVTGAPISQTGGYTDSYGTDQGDYGSSDTTATIPQSSSATTPVNPEMESVRPSTVGEEELQLQLALAMSKEEADEDERRRRGDDLKLQMAIEESKKKNEEEAKDTLLELLGNQGAAGAQAADPWAAPLAPAADPWAPKPTSDPWTSPAGSRPATAASDPWSGGSAHSTPQGPTPVQNADPWNPSTDSGSQSSPWGSPAPPAYVGSNTTSPQASFNNNFGASNGATGQPAGVDEAFDLLSSRTTSSKSNGAGNGTDEFDLLSGGTKASNAFDMSDLGQNLDNGNSDESGGKKKTAEEFLGANASLVNLDNLITAPAPAPANTVGPFSGSTNPFGVVGTAPASNPFGPVQQQNRTPLNQMQTSNSMGFNSAGSTVLPTPLVPTNQQPGNPFL